MVDKWLMGAFLSIVGACNYKCIYCSAHEQILDGSIIDYLDIIKIYEILKSKKVCKINITGGEPFLHKNIEEIIRLSTNNFSTTVLTNGSLVKDHVEFLKNYQNKKRLRFSVSLDSGKLDRNEITRGINSFDSSLNGIELLNKWGYSVTVLSTVTNYYEIEDLKSLIRKIVSIGGKQINLTPLQPCGMAKSQFDILKPSIRLLNEIEDIIPKLSRKYNINIGKGFGKCYINDNTTHREFHLLPCKAGITQISIRSNGDVYPCNALEIYMGNIFKSDIDYILERSEGAQLIHRISKEKISTHTICANCKHNRNCTGGCRGVAYGETGDIYHPDIYCDQLSTCK